MLNKKALTIFSLVLFSSFLLGSICLAQGSLEIEYPEIAGEKPEITTITLPGYVRYIFNLSLALAGLIAFFSTILGGVCYLTSAGSPAKQKNCKEQILSGVLGLAILLSSYLILVTINPQLVVFRFPPLQKINIPTTQPTIPTEEETVLTYFQIPTGKIIERPFDTIIEDVEYYDYNDDCTGGESLIQQDLPLLDAANVLSLSLKCASNELNQAIYNLEQEVKKCGCGATSCKAVNFACFVRGKCINDYGRSKYCNEPKIMNVLVPAVATKKDKLMALIQPGSALDKIKKELSENLLNLKKASLLMNAPASINVRDYYTMLKTRQDLEKYDIKIEFYPSETNPDPSFPGWEDALLKTGNIDPATFYFYKEGQGTQLINEAKNLSL